MTLQEAKSIARHLGLTLRKVRSGDYRVNFRDGNETTAYYTDNLEDAVKTAVEMARTRDVMQAVDEAVATEPLQGRHSRHAAQSQGHPPEAEE
jgi:L-ribulose-5-phosphate 3-epimerase UlaE